MVLVEKSDRFVVAKAPVLDQGTRKDVGNAHGAKGPSQQGFIKGSVVQTPRWSTDATPHDET